MISFFITTSFSVVAKDSIVKVYDKGQDGGMRIYSVACPNGKKTTITRVINSSLGKNKSQQKLTKGLSSDAIKGSSIKLQVQVIKKKALRLIGQQNRAEICLYPINSEKECKSYKDVDTAAKAACDLTP